ncbi:hypothetical protein DFR52_103397 [Hoeflea marina]|uniref:4-amino-4-deoxy-L-arabinose transferase-like glycosyltransferase n=1 Tax=Hoeflea marina TaxID=274592 RepID=A0A317PKK6_9HYPH|nr:hypothetical protein DFR52_103397 [Hoeflea marina]
MEALHKPVAIAFAIFVLLTVIMHFFGYTDYIGSDNDDVMRLVEVRDLLGGQGWFDMTQYRLGMAEGTQMHWSRLVDLPIAGLILFFSAFFGQTLAEAAALFVWPLLTAVPILYGLALGARSLGGVVASTMGLVAAFLFVMGGSRFHPGSIDHTNVQLGIMAVIAACLVSPWQSPRAFAMAGFGAALAVAIGVETTPHVAVACILVALLWAWHGETMRASAGAFALVVALSLSGFFFLTVPPGHYSVVVCDALSTGFYALGVVGSGGLFLAVSLASRQSFAIRLASLGAVGAATGALALLIAPACLSNPLANLDPLLVTMWLNNVTEAQSVWSQFAIEPWTSAIFYAVPLLAMMVCAARVLRRERAQSHLVLFALIFVSYAITLIQVRGAVFANMLSFIPLAALVADLRDQARADPKNVRKGVLFAGAALASIPFVWGLAGLGLMRGYEAAIGRESDAVAVAEEPVCTDGTAMLPLSREPAGVVAAASNLGAPILRFTDHRVLSAPYHRNQAGMLAELQAGMAPPAAAETILRKAGVTLVAFCKSDPQVKNMSEAEPAGLYAHLGNGKIPGFLEPIPATMAKPLQIFRLR